MKTKLLGNGIRNAVLKSSALALWLLATHASAAPVITKVEPPNW
jgi:hypothetical protein